MRYKSNRKLCFSIKLKQCWVCPKLQDYFSIERLKKWFLFDKTVYSKPMTTISIRKTMHWGQLGSSTGPNNRATKWGERSSERHPCSHQRKVSRQHWDGKGAGRRRGSLFSAIKLSLNKFTTGGNWSLSKASQSSAPSVRGYHLGEKSSKVHWSAQEMRTGVWASSFFWVSAKPLWPLKWKN